MFIGVLRQSPDDFQVIERLDIDFSGDGEHDYLNIKKTGANTHWVAEQLAAFAGVGIRDVGYAGLKDRYAVTEQWFSVFRRPRRETDWRDFAADGVELLCQERHQRKLRRGAHRSNAFRIVVRSDGRKCNDQALTARLEQLAELGVPNYFGEQRFGRDGGNIRLAERLFAGRRLSRAKRSMAMSAARSLIFNEILEERVRRDSWATLLPGECANLDGSGSIFHVADVTTELETRCAAMDIHPSGSLWGDAAPLGSGAVGDIERDVAARHAVLRDGLVAAGLKAMARPLRLCVRELSWSLDDTTVVLQFELPSGAYATSVVRELADAQDFDRST